MHKHSKKNTFSLTPLDVKLITDSHRRFTIFDIPTEILLDIQEYLSLWGLNNLYQTCRHFRNSLAIVLAKRVMAAKDMEIMCAKPFTVSRNLLTNKSYCWGKNNQGQLGLSDRKQRLKPSLFISSVIAGKKVESMIVGRGSVHAKLEDNTWYCWGSNGYGSLGIGNSMSRSTPTLFKPEAFSGREIEALYIAACHVFANLDDGTWYCWGDNTRSQLGLGDNMPNWAYAPLQFNPEVFAGDKIEAMFVGPVYTFAKLESGTYYSWGDNFHGQLGVGDRMRRSTPSLFNPEVFAGREVVALYTAACHVFANLDDGTWYCWGNNENGQLGFGDRERRLKPKLFNPADFAGRKIVELYCEDNFMFTNLDDGTWYCWGDNKHGQLGLGDNECRYKPVPFKPAVFLDRKIDVMYISSSSSYAKLEDGSWYCWGDNIGGSLGLGDKNSRFEPVQHPFLYSNVETLKEVALAEDSSIFAQELKRRLKI